MSCLGACDGKRNGSDVDDRQRSDYSKEGARATGCFKRSGRDSENRGLREREAAGGVGEGGLVEGMGGREGATGGLKQRGATRGCAGSIYERARWELSAEVGARVGRGG